MGNAVGKDRAVQRVFGKERGSHRLIIIGAIARQLVRIRDRPSIDIASRLKGPGDFHAPFELRLQIAVPQIRRLHDMPVSIDDGKSVVHRSSSFPETLQFDKSSPTLDGDGCLVLLCEAERILAANQNQVDMTTR